MLELASAASFQRTQSLFQAPCFTKSQLLRSCGILQLPTSSVFCIQQELEGVFYKITISHIIAVLKKVTHVNSSVEKMKQVEDTVFLLQFLKLLWDLRQQTQFGLVSIMYLWNGRLRKRHGNIHVFEIHNCWFGQVDKCPCYSFSWFMNFQKFWP